MDRRLRLCALATCGWFVAVLVLPFLQSVFHFVREGDVTENRALAGFPKLTLRAELPREIQDYWNDHFGFRLPLGTAAAHIALSLGESPNEQVVVGKDGWLFYHENLTTTKGPAAEQIQRAADTYSAYQEWLASRGIVYMLMLPLDKQSVYPEFLPDHLDKVESIDLYRRFRSFVEQKQLALNLIDVADVTDAWKKRGQQLYYSSDVHWNPLGATVVACAMNAAFRQVWPAIPKREMSDYDWQETTITGGDLAGMVSVPARFHSRSFDVHPRVPMRAKPVSAFTIEGRAPARQPIAMEVPDPSLPSVFFYRDSFMDLGMPPIAENFRRSVYVWNYGAFWPDMILREAPDLVVSEAVERLLAWVAPLDPLIRDELDALKRLRERFAATADVVDRLAARGPAPLVFRPRAARDAERARSAVLAIDAPVQTATVLAIDIGDGHPQKRVLYPRAHQALVTLARWPTEIRVERRAGALAPDATVELILKAVEPETIVKR